MYYRGKEGELETFVVTLSGFIYIIWQFVVYLCNVNQQNAHFLNLCFISILHVFYVFRTSRVHLQEYHLYVLFCNMFFMYLCKQSSRWEDMLDTESS